MDSYSGKSYSSGIGCLYSSSNSAIAFRIDGSECSYNQQILHTHNVHIHTHNTLTHSHTQSHTHTLTHSLTQTHIYSITTTDTDVSTADTPSPTTIRPPATPRQCPFVDDFACDNGECVFDFQRCDGGDDCGDYSDEDGCGKSINHSMCI